MMNLCTNYVQNMRHSTNEYLFTKKLCNKDFNFDCVNSDGSFPAKNSTDQ